MGSGGLAGLRPARSSRRSESRARARLPATHHVGGRGRRGRLLQRGAAVAPLPAAPRLPRRGPGRTLLAAAAHASRSPGRRGLLLRLDAGTLGRALRKGGRWHFKAPFSAWFSVRVSVHPTVPGERGKSSVPPPGFQGACAAERGRRLSGWGREIFAGPTGASRGSTAHVQRRARPGTSGGAGSAGRAERKRGGPNLAPRRAQGACAPLRERVM